MVFICIVFFFHGEGDKPEWASELKDFDIKPLHEGYAIKKPVFSFNKFPNVNKELGPEMKSTGEEILFVKDTKEPVFRELYNQKSMYLSR